MALYKNITTAGSPATTDLISRTDDPDFSIFRGGIRKITISNNDGDQADNVALFLEDDTAAATTNAGNVKYYFFKDLDIPQGASATIDSFSPGMSVPIPILPVLLSANNVEIPTDKSPPPLETSMA